MKKILFFSVFLISVFYSYSQEVINNEGQEIFTLVENMPSWKGCENIITQVERNNCTYDKIMNFLVSEIKYPAIAQENGIQGKVYISFVIDTAGYVTKPKILRGVSPELDAEALRVVSQMPPWNAGQQRGRYVNVAYNLPVSFKLSQDGE